MLNFKQVGMVISLVCVPLLGVFAANPADITFFVTADTHFGPELEEVNNKVQIAAMNGIPGIAYPNDIGGNIDLPLGVIIAGDLTNGILPAAPLGQSTRWPKFLEHYGLTGTEGLLDYPVYECLGNNDIDLDVPVAVKQRHGDEKYSWDWGILHVICLSIYPNAGIREWLANDLTSVGPERPIVIFHHYGFDPLSSTYWSSADREAYQQTLDGYNIIGIFHGHNHESWHYTWEGYDVYDVGAPSGSSEINSFAVVHVTPDTFSVAEYLWTKDENDQWDGGSWDWYHTKSITSPIPTNCEEAWEYGYGIDADTNRDCRIDFKDFALFAFDWLICNDPNQANCQ